jgi:hypothetical protein
LFDVEIEPVQYPASVVFDHQVANRDDWPHGFTVK